ncbi:NMDA receptor-regulated protein 1 [Pyricularia oryzae 70-15]|uniref:NMDA receptor-regulated protein 1 n=3 Tax=Pyricularia oryzae TaxID=318829 RepID=G4N4R1_PYRO7|nr:NMDA receptor-regulated protein 1 [Pyricularia oryzae 70-15]EHA52876.1 NMDA receptor-regulated protein 1 [Pyricularia oryzae 70-15]ELQ38996.1 NMDA receptor-regulated protein 1 [Pyricularia oryzae Y34]KAI7927705.1 NMDA receptor-regulated protein 1 [Pyricularia oryzae]KAI7930574.1 NMDA receptor-regulated protein 1 [Pyricularia oryzae]
MSPSQPLSTRDSNLLRTVVRNFEDKQYRRGLKAAEQILKKNPKHGETMAMKALIMNAQGKTEEAFALGKEAVSVDMKSHVVWHVYGMLYKTQKNFDEAIKAYKFALRLEPKSAQIQRDLAILQIQMRDYQGYVQTRMQMLTARPQLRQNWTAVAIAHHLAGNLAEAENILTTYEQSLKVPPSRADFEHSEAIMYKNTIIAESGDTQRALDHLEEISKSVLDRLAVMETRAKYLSELGKKEEATKAWRALLDRNPDHADYYYGLAEAMGISDDVAAKQAIFDEYAKKAPRCDAARRLPLDILSGDEFKTAAREYLTSMLNKGVPSTFANLKHLYSDSFKKSTLPELVLEYISSQESSGETNGDSSKGKAAALYFMAQHYNYHLSRDLSKAMEFVEKAIELAPTSVDFHMTKARIWKHHGNTQKASETMDQARGLDKKDRYVNTKAAKYMLRNNENEQALEIMGLFTRAETPGGPLADLLDMQSVWFLTEDGEAYARRGNIGMALKRFHAIFNIFDIWQEDQYDFHTFSLRKGLVRAYVDMIRWEDRLREHPFYSRMALDAIKIYLDLHDSQEPAADTNGVNGTSDGTDGLSEEAIAEKKKAAKKAKKAQEKAEREAQEKAAKENPNKGQKNVKAVDGEPPKKVDDDPSGLKLAATKDPLGEAVKFLVHLLQFSPKHIEAQLAGFEVYIRRNKYILALGCLNAARAIDPNHPRLHEQSIRMRSALNAARESLPPKVAEVIDLEFTTVPPSADLNKLNKEFRDQNKGKPAHELAAIRASKYIGADQKQSEKDITSILNIESLTLEDAEAAMDTLKSWRSSELETAKKAAKSRFPEATVFA